MSNHLQFCKWRDSAFSAEQFKSTRWLLNARPKQVPESLKDVLTVTPMAQVMLLELHVHSFLQASRRLKVSQRARVRASADDFEKLADFACIFASIRQKAKAASSDPEVDGKLLDAFMAKFLGIPSVFDQSHSYGCCSWSYCWSPAPGQTEGLLGWCGSLHYKQEPKFQADIFDSLARHCGATLSAYGAPDGGLVCWCVGCAGASTC